MIISQSNQRRPQIIVDGRREAENQSTHPQSLSVCPGQRQIGHSQSLPDKFRPPCTALQVRGNC